ncbi:MAG: 4Fe-4S dicluster domain-containing protein [Candidatus Latescibacterota bacterium]|nr:MAG: 4Fe-4S dicluster domain-containing protein [Candidatus Latescibacterota bacterium]
MQSFIAIGFLLGLASALGIILAVANAKLKVFEDPRIDQVHEMLPNSNCGACGLPGCRVFAEKAVAGQIQPSQCTVGGSETAAAVADYLGVDAGTVEKTTARVLCAGGTNVSVQMAEYKGFPTCRAAVAAGGGGKGCRYGCLGFGDCEAICDFDALTMGPTGLPIIDIDKCTSCGDCVRICPKYLIEILPVEQHLVVQCKSELEGDEILELCKVACTACGRCVADGAQGLLRMKRNLPVVNTDLLHMQSPDAIKRCPTGAITWVEDQQFRNTPESGKPEPPTEPIGVV